MPSYIDMVKTAITDLKERGGSSLSAIKKHLIANQSCDFTKGSDKSHLLRALKNGVEKAVLIQNKGSYKVAKAAAKKKKKGGGGITAPKDLSSELAYVCGFESGSRGEVIKAVWAYIRDNDLKGPDGIKCDSAMKKVFKKTKLGNTEIMGGISPHLS